MGDENRIITFNYARNTWDVYKKQNIPSSNECMTKDDVNNYLNADMTVLSGYTSKRLIPRSKFLGIMPNNAFDQFDFDAPVYDVKIQTDKKILVGGGFSKPRKAFVRLELNGRLDQNFLGENTTNTGGIINTIDVDNNNNIYAGGNFTSFGGFSDIQNLVKLDSNGIINTNFKTSFSLNQSGVNPDVRRISIIDNKSIMVAGLFAKYKGENTGSLINIDLNSNKQFDNYQWVVDSNNAKIPAVNNLLSKNYTIYYSGGDLYRTSSYAGVDAVFVNDIYNTGYAMGGNGVVRYPVIGRSTSPYQNDGAVLNSIFQPDGKMIVVGLFDRIDYKLNIVSNIARFTTGGLNDTSFNQGKGFNGICYAIALQPDGKILVGGTFTSYNMTQCNRIIRLAADGSVDTSFVSKVGIGFNDTVRVIKVQSDGKIIVGGDFTTYDGYKARYLTRLNADGSLNTTDAESGIGSISITNISEINDDAWYTTITYDLNVVGTPFVGYVTSTIRLSSSNSTYGSTTPSPYGESVNANDNDVDIFKTVPVTIPKGTYRCSLYISVTQLDIRRIASSLGSVYYSLTTDYYNNFLDSISGGAIAVARTTDPELKYL